MESYIVDWDLDSSISNFSDKIADMFENTFVPKLSACSNLTYLGMATNSSRREAVFQIGSSTNVYLRICKNDRNDFYSTDYPYARLSSTADLTTCNSYLTPNSSSSYGAVNSLLQTNNTNVKFNFWLLTDNAVNKRLNMLWAFKSPAANIEKSQGIIFGQTESGRDFVGTMGSTNNPICIYYLDDTTVTPYKIPTDFSIYAVTGKVLKKNWWPVTTDGTISTIVDNLASPFVRIYNSDMNSIEQSNGINKDSNSIRKLIEIDNALYRQVVANYWIADPKGDETAVTITNVT
ncbi:MAG: hypothetical protein J6Y02_01415 [Pseudobutyrivibrio sp.]|nr:hypothetical protein [Pseudobutyrivibrio sp.]